MNFKGGTRGWSGGVSLALLLLLAAGAAWAQTPAEPVSSLVADEAKEAMKYRHLWIAYAAIWLLIMAFVWRTARRQAETERELKALAARIEEMEKGRD